MDDWLIITFKNFAPRQEYRLFFDDRVSIPVVERADDNGDMRIWYVIPHGVVQPGDPPLTVEIFALDYGRGPNPNKIARKTFWVKAEVIYLPVIVKNSG
jgi:hypothetical protein